MSTSPIVTLNPVDGNYFITAGDAANGVVVSGTATGVPLGQPLTLVIDQVNEPQVFFDNAIPVNSDGTWSVAIPASVLQGIPDGQYFFSAYDYPALVAEGQTAGNPVVETVTVEEHSLPPPTITFNPTNVTLSAGSLINAYFQFPVSGEETGLNGANITMQMSDSSGHALGAPLTSVGHPNGGWIFQVSDQSLLDNVTQPTNGLTFTVSGINANGSVTASETYHTQPSYEAPSADIQAFTPAELNLLANLGVHRYFADGPGNVDFSAAQVRVLENNRIAVSGQAGVQIELSDSANNVLSLLGGASFKFTDVVQNLQKLENVGVTNIDVQVGHGNHTVEVTETVAQLLADFQQLANVPESHDSFVFAPNLGENTNVHSNVHDETIDHAKSEFTQFAELLSQPHQDAANLPHDAADPVHHAATLNAQHAHHFLV